MTYEIRENRANRRAIITEAGKVYGLAVADLDYDRLQAVLRAFPVGHKLHQQAVGQFYDAYAKKLGPCLS